MHRRTTLLMALVIATVGCGSDAPPPQEDAPASATGSQPASAPSRARPGGPLESTAWFAVDHDARTVHMTVTAGATSAGNYWNFNGYMNGELLIAVPEGYQITIDFVNQDPTMPHSLGVSAELNNFMTPIAPNPVFAGAITSNPTSMTGSTLPGATETITFTASEAGNYSLVCYIAGHTSVGMWIFFDVTTDGSAGAATM